MSNAYRPEELFGLDLLSSHLSGFQPPQGPHEPAGDWEFEYRMYSLAAISGVGGMVGSVRVGRKRRDGDRFTLDVDCRKMVHDGRCARLAGQVEARLATLPVPLRWSWTGEILDAAPDAPPLAQLKHSAALEGGVVKFSGSKRTIPLAGPCTINWLLFEAVGRLPHEAFAPLDFTLIDDFDLPKPQHRLSYAATESLVLGQHRERQTKVEELDKGRIHTTAWGMTGGQTVRLHTYHRVGEGNVPWIYRVDPQGRLLFAVSGFEAYVLNSFGKA
jgi:hypothetical protein